MPTEHSDLLLPQEVAEILRLKLNSVYAAASDGRLPCVLLWRGRRKSLVRFRKTDIEALIHPTETSKSVRATGI